MWEKSKCVQNHHPEQTPICYIEWKLSHWAWWDDTTPPGRKGRRKLEEGEKCICNMFCGCHVLFPQVSFLGCCSMTVCLFVCLFFGWDGGKKVVWQETNQAKRGPHFGGKKVRKLAGCWFICYANWTGAASFRGWWWWERVVALCGRCDWLNLIRTSDSGNCIWVELWFQLWI